MTAVICWVVLMIVLVVIEVIRLDLTCIWLGVGALLASVAALFGLPVWAQGVVFAVLSLLLMLLVKPVIKHKLEKKKTELRKEEEERDKS